MNVQQFVANYLNKLINNGGTQCVALVNEFNKVVVQGGWIGTPISGYANDWWNNFGNSNMEQQYYVRVGAGEGAQEGDVAIWQKYPSSGLPHIAVVLEDRGANGILCFTQNPGSAHKEVLTKSGLLGYLRPKKFVKPAGPPKASDAEIAQAYRDILGREPDAGGLAHYRAYTLDFVRNDLNNSNEKHQRDAQAAQPAAPAPAPASGFSVGDTVVPTRLVDYNGTALTSWDPQYTITEVINDRAVLSARGAIWAAMRTSDIRKV